MLNHSAVMMASRRCSLAVALAAVAATSLCSCRGPQTNGPTGPGNCPPEMIGAAGMNVAAPCPPEMAPGQPCASWRPDGLPCPWPEDEYICDGGDADVPASVTRDWRVNGLENEDTVAHFDTLDGRRLIEPSNRVCLYAPRFGAVRQVVSLVANEHADRLVAANANLKPTLHEDTRPVLSAKQNVQPIGEVVARPPVAMLGRRHDGALSTAIKPRAYDDAFKPYEDIAVIRMGIIEASEAAMLAKGAAAAVAWKTQQAVQVIIDHDGVAESTRYEQAEQTFTYKTPTGCPQLRVIKVASTPAAEPGDKVDFTIRFDNVGTEAIGNVTILDSLSPRLELLADSAQCSRKAEFSTEPNEAGSVVLRCEVADPLKPGDGGVIRFTCRVR